MIILLIQWISCCIIEIEGVPVFETGILGAAIDNIGFLELQHVDEDCRDND